MSEIVPYLLLLAFFQSTILFKVKAIPQHTYEGAGGEDV
jgi:hypothetical protein